MDAGQLDRRITLQRKTEADDGYATEVSSWADIATVWARLMPQSSAERVVAGEQAAFDRQTFMIRRDNAWSDLNAADRILYNGDPLNILGVREHGRGFYLIDVAGEG